MTNLIQAHLRWLKAAGRADATITKRRRLLLHMDRHLPYGLDRASEDEIIDYLAAYSEPWTLYTYDTHARGFYRWAVARQRLTLDPMLDLPRPRQGACIPHPCTDDELATALTARAPYGRAIRLASALGLRCSEIANADRTHIVGRRLRVTGKGRKVRMVPIPAWLWNEVDRPGPLLGTHTNGERLSDGQRPVWRRLGLPDTFRLHSGRHWYATRLLEAGVDIRVVQELLGHSSVATTEGYTAVTDARVARAAEMLPLVQPLPGSSRQGLPEAA